MVRLDISFFGPFQVTLDHQLLTHFRSSKTQGLFIYLALNNERPQSREVLATLLWPEESQANSRNNLRQSLFQLRKLFGDLEEPVDPFFLATRQTVQFNPESDYDLDVDRFIKAIEENDLETAIASYYGELLPGFTCDSLEFEAWLRQERERLHRLALVAMFEITQDHLQAGRLEQAQETARRQLRFEPWRERAHRQLIQAYALAGDRGSALAQYDICREQLSAELGVEPTAETVALVAEIKSGRFGPVAVAPNRKPPAKVRHNLPANTTPFIGRELELTHIKHLLTQDKQRLVTIVGPGGMGKTRLALAAGVDLLDQFRDGVIFVDLASLAQVDEIVPALAMALDYQAPNKSQDMFPQLLQTLGEQQRLLIMDNFEHLLTGAKLVNDMLQACPQVSILVTSRQRLNLASESRFELSGLEYPDSLSPEEALTFTAVQLFVDHGRRALSHFVLSNDNVADVIRICQLVQGMPLGLVLAAAWLEMLTPAEIAREIEACFYFLAAELADLPPRQRDIHAVFDRSWRMMGPEEQDILSKLSVFRGGFTREAAEQVAGANLRVLLTLMNKSFLQRRAESGRFTIHELLRQFASLKLHQAKDSNDVYLAHCRYYARLLAEETDRSLNMYPLDLPRKHAHDRDNIRRAWDYARRNHLAPELARMARGMASFSFAQGNPPKILLEPAISALLQHGMQETDLPLLELRLVELITRSEYDLKSEIRQRFLDFLTILPEYADTQLLYWAYDSMAFMEIDDDMAQSLYWQEKSCAVAQNMEDGRFMKRTQALSLWFRLDSGFEAGLSLADISEFREGTLLEQLQDLLAFFVAETPRSFVVFSILMSLCIYNLWIKMYDQAFEYGQRGLNIAKDWQDLYWISFAGDRLADAYLQMGRPDQAAAQLLDIFEWHLAIGQVWQTLGYLWSKPIRFSKLFGGWESVLPILTFVYYHPDTVPFYRREVEKNMPRIEAEIGTEAFTSAWKTGQMLDLKTTISRVRSILSAGVRYEGVPAGKEPIG